MRVFLLLVLAGCAPPPRTVDEACTDRVPGAKHGDANAVDGVWRANCYRRMARVRSGGIEASVQAGALDHLDYMRINGLDVSEAPENDGYTGETGFERAVGNGYTRLDAANAGVWDAVGFTDGRTPAEVVDDWIDQFYYRQMVLHPDWVDGGWAQDEDYVAATILYSFPSRYHEEFPVIYPGYQQLEVPTTYYHLWAGYDDLPNGEALGYPITLTVTSGTILEGASLSNPYMLQVQTARLTGPDGDVELFEITPETTVAPFAYSIALIPTQPLETSTDYQLTVELQWSGELKLIESEFTTAASHPDPPT